MRLGRQQGREGGTVFEALSHLGSDFLLPIIVYVMVWPAAVFIVGMPVVMFVALVVTIIRRVREALAGRAL